MRRILAVINRLPRAEREVLALCVWSALTYADAAVALGIPIGTVRSRLSRAKERARNLLAASNQSIEVNPTEQKDRT